MPAAGVLAPRFAGPLPGRPPGAVPAPGRASSRPLAAPVPRYGADAPPRYGADAPVLPAARGVPWVIAFGPRYGADAPRLWGRTPAALVPAPGVAGPRYGADAPRYGADAPRVAPVWEVPAARTGGRAALFSRRGADAPSGCGGAAGCTCLGVSSADESVLCSSTADASVGLGVLSARLWGTSVPGEAGTLWPTLLARVGLSSVAPLVSITPLSVEAGGSWIAVAVPTRTGVSTVSAGA